MLAERLDSLDPASDLPALARGQLSGLRTLCREALKRNLDPMTTAHLQDVLARISLALNKMRLVEGAVADSR